MKKEKLNKSLQSIEQLSRCSELCGEEFKALFISHQCFITYGKMMRHFLAHKIAKFNQRQTAHIAYSHIESLIREGLLLCNDNDEVSCDFQAKLKVFEPSEDLMYFINSEVQNG